MALSPGDRVRLNRGRGPEGVVVNTNRGGAYIKLDDGTACTFHLDELTALPPAEPESKSWPPEDIETK